MAIENDDELGEVVTRVGSDIQDIQDYLADNPDSTGRVRFPRGFIRTANNQRARLDFLEDGNLKNNVAYGLMLSDVYKWILTRTDLSGIAREMTIKACLFLAGALAESIIYHFLDRVVGGQRRYSYRCEWLLNNGIIDDALKDALDWLWEMRSRMHLFLVQQAEFDHYRIEDYLRCARVMRQLILLFSDYYENNQQRPG